VRAVSVGVGVGVEVVLLLAAGSSGSEAPSTLVVHNYYYAKPGLADSVYRVRKTASAIRARAGLVVGRVLRRTGGSDSLPDVIWEAEYADSAARAWDLLALEGNVEFSRIQAVMGGLLRRFERASWAADGR